MAGVLLDGSATAKKILAEVKDDVLRLKEADVEPRLAIILVGKNPASLSYIKQKKRAGEEVGISYVEVFFDEEVQTHELIGKIEELNNDASVHGILVQLPLPAHVEVPLVIRAIDPKKDVDGFHAYNLGKMFLSTEFEDLAPCTPRGAIRLLEEYDIDVRGKEVVVVGHSNIVGKPLSTMLLNRNATVTTCHIDTKDLDSHTRRADIIFTAVGKTNLITANMVKDGVVVVDIGIVRTPDGLRGDVDFPEVLKKASYITPVPGGAGPMTVACLMENLTRAARRQTQDIPS